MRQRARDVLRQPEPARKQRRDVEARSRPAREHHVLDLGACGRRVGGEEILADRQDALQRALAWLGRNNRRQAEDHARSHGTSLLEATKKRARGAEASERLQ